MESPPPPYTRSSSRLADVIVATPPASKPSAPSPLRLSAHRSPLKELLLLSPSPSPTNRSRPRPMRMLLAAAAEDPAAHDSPQPPGRRGRSRTAAALASPRNGWRARRRLERDIGREEREIVGGLGEEGGKVVRRRKRQSRNSKVAAANGAENLSLIPFVPSPVPLSPRVEIDDNDNRLEGLWEQFLQLVLWKNVAKSTLWFGFGSMFILSSCFSRELSFSMVSAICQLGLLILGIAFVKDTVPQKQQLPKGNFQLTEDNIIRIARAILPIANTILGKIQELLCGEPLMTLKVAPVLLLGAKYGHLVTLWRLFAVGFFVSFTIPKLYSCYSEKIQLIVQRIIYRSQEAWETCPRKKFVVASTATLFWNLFSVKTRIFAAFISLVVLRYHHQRASEEKYTSDERNEKQPMVVEDSGQA